MSNSKRLAIITPYYKEARDILERCVNSVKHQSVSAGHFVVSDGFPQDWLDSEGVRHLRLGRAHGDAGNTARGIGALLAVSEGYDGIGLLDADNWYDNDHVEECCRAANSFPEVPADLVTAKRRIFLSDGTPTNLPDQPGYVDTSCFWFLEGSFHLLHYWVTMPVQFAPSGDACFYRMIKAHALNLHHTQKITVNYTSIYEAHYRAMGRMPPLDARATIQAKPIFDWVYNLSPRQLRLVQERCGVDLLIWARELGLAKESSSPRTATKRNDPCPCGSGRKYKHCHGK